MKCYHLATLPYECNGLPIKNIENMYMKSTLLVLPKYYFFNIRVTILFGLKF